MGCAASTPSSVLDTELPFHSCYELEEELGRGSFGKVRVCINKRTKVRNAVKVLNGFEEKLQMKAARELAVWKQVGVHKNVVVLVDSYVEHGWHYFVMQRCCQTLSDKFKGKFCHVEFLDAFHQVFLGLGHCHSMDVVHRDIKAPNVLIGVDGTVKIADFGLSLVLPKGGSITGMVGSAPFMSPEMLQGKSYGFDTDVWSCGAVIYDMVYGVYPYDAPSASHGYLSVKERKRQMQKAIVKNEPKPAYEAAAGILQPSPSVRELIESLLQRNLPNRPDASSCGKLTLSAKESLQNNGAVAFVESGSSHVGKWSPPNCIASSCEVEDQRASVDTRCPTDSNSRHSYGGSSKCSSL
jgi:serine/threonine protein kinase